MTPHLRFPLRLEIRNLTKRELRWDKREGEEELQVRTLSLSRSHDKSVAAAATARRLGWQWLRDGEYGLLVLLLWLVMQKTNTYSIKKTGYVLSGGFAVRLRWYQTIR